jgi:EmrB/QacA subfamily drug resistance transporter
MAATTHAPPLPAPRLAAKGLALLILLSAAQFMVTVDVTVTNLATPAIGRTLGLAASDLSWVVTAYTLMTGALLLLGGRLADIVGARRTFLAGLGVFTTASLVAGLAQSEVMLIGARAAQGAGAALLSPAALAVLVSSFTGAQRTRALAVWGAVASAGAAIGVLLGGALVTWASWRWAFLINVPVGVAAAVLVPRLISAREVRRGGSLDLPGALTVTTALFALVYAIERAPDDGWGSAQTIGLFALSAALLAAFTAIERRAAHPLVPAGLFRSKTTSAGTLTMFVATALLVGMFFLGSIYMQQTLGLDAIEAGLGFLPVALIIGFAAHAGSHLLPKVGTRVTATAGLLLAGAGNLLLTGVDAGGSYFTDVMPGLLVGSAGIGLAFVTASVTSMHGVPHERAGLASGVMTTAHEIGAALGVAVLSAIALSGVGALDFGLAFTVAGTAGLAAAAVALVAFPAIKPSAGARAMMH